jgi:hypothetical protein
MARATPPAVGRMQCHQANLDPSFADTPASALTVVAVEASNAVCWA